ncbi:MAG: hypothetical protein O3A93_07005 [Chloroflexi bacterium]|nr:hypothetical protein [Chloroflexota bacterium]MDA1270992.1 hypothetical protein [Chloroflexota bacterium]PKB58259.1 MAG: hypothetical protein BZY83_08040 [SAR202 cluster bacterium Casp-Chloro-G2]
MRLPLLPNVKTVIRRTPRLFNNDTYSVGRIITGFRRVEYEMFMAPVLNPFGRVLKRVFTKTLGNDRASDSAAEALRALGAIAPAVSPSPGPDLESMPGLTPVAPGRMVQAGEDAVDPKLVEEIFARPTPSAAPNEPAPADQANEPGEDPVRPAASEGGEESTDAEAVVTLDDGEPETGPPLTGRPQEASSISTPNGHRRGRSTPEPLVRTMVEAIPDLQIGGGGLNDLLSGDLQDIFNTATYTDPRTKALLASREPVDVYALAKELDEFARSIGASPRKS